MHITEEIPIKTALVDIGIKNLVNWLNKFESINTLYSCQGLTEEEKKEADKNLVGSSLGPVATSKEHPEGSYYPYVSFLCDDQEQLALIIDCIQKWRAEYTCGDEYITIDVDYDNEYQKLKYCLRMGKSTTPDHIVEYWHNIYKPSLMKKFDSMP